MLYVPCSVHQLFPAASSPCRVIHCHQANQIPHLSTLLIQTRRSLQEAAPPLLLQQQLPG
jgi:hypothetical protein